MKNFLLTIFLCLLYPSIYQANAQTYNNNDKEGLRIFLRQPSSEAGVSNFELTGLSVSDTLSWYASETWVTKLRSSEGSNATSWNNDSPNRLTFLNLIGTQSTRKLGGVLDCSKFPMLQTLWAWENKFSSVKIAGLSKLADVDIHTNNLTELDASNCSVLSRLSFGDNPIINVNLSNTMALTLVNSSSTPLSTLDLSNRTQLQILLCHGSGLISLNLENTPALADIRCHYSKLTQLDLSNHPALETIFCSDNQLTQLNLNNTPSLQTILASRNQLTGTIDLSNHDKLFNVDFNTNQLSAFNVSNCPVLENFSCGDNKLTTLNVVNTPSLKSANVGMNLLTSADFSNHPQLTALWCSSNRLMNLNLTNTPALQELNCWINQLSELDMSNRPALKYLHCNENLLTSLNISNTPNLLSLNASRNQLAGVFDLSNRDKLEVVDLNTNKISGCNAANTPLLSRLQCGDGPLTMVDLANTPSLTFLNVSNSELASLDVSGQPKLTTLWCGSSYISSLNLSNTPSLQEVACGYDYLKFSTLPIFNGPVYNYGGQRIMDGGAIPCNWTIDLSSEYNIRGNITTYEWYGEWWNPITIQNLGQGKFIAGSGHVGRLLYCIMTNPAYPQLRLQYQVRITDGIFRMLEHLTLVESPRQDIYAAESGQTFKIYANTEALPEDVRIGLFKTTGGFVQEINISRVNKLYTCVIPNSVEANTYMIQPYTLDLAGDRKIIERMSGSPVIDKLPFASIRNYQTLQATQVQSHLVLNTSEKYLHKVYIGDTFNVLANMSVTPGTQIGLFELDGNFVENLTKSISGIQYNCKVSDFVYPNRYIIMPYEVVNGAIRIVERAAGAAIMDRLPVVVDYRYSGTLRSSTVLTSVDQIQSGTSVSVYPNPATDQINVNSQNTVNCISIYSLRGTLLKQAMNTTSIAISELPSGVYIVKVSTLSGESIFKVKKN